MTSSNCRFLLKNGLIPNLAENPSVTTLLEAHQGAYTTTRTHSDGSLLLFWERHMSRLSNSLRILLNSNPELLFNSEACRVPFFFVSTKPTMWDSLVQSLVDDSMRKALPLVLDKRRNGEELAITCLVSGNVDSLEELEENFSTAFDVYVHVGSYVPPLFGIHQNGARLAVVGCGRRVANAKYSDWVRQRKQLEKLRPPYVNELLLSNNGDQILEGCLTNLFVVCHKDVTGDYHKSSQRDNESTVSIELQTAPIRDGVLPGVVRQVILDICSRNKIPVREIAPSWSEREMWSEAFITSSLRLLQHVEVIQAPSSWESLDTQTWTEVTWEEKQFENAPGRITAVIQKEVMEMASMEGYPVSLFDDR
ncbi:uncharacterized protein [Solanum tuberosum]|uniref:Class IV aminotransferase n=2 Tax=Solanum tuberosum TaxID=4113 RepID=M1APN5_SOLTU|nr:PREDICTED: uncharacterized protein LOC102592512 isoform X3 [Solanum tuberosum]XP_015159021.1 PREDICTED: uncharacterized protein LOC102592512 isoform X3 [Solanum tuberosum]XP_015159026.1 PREDICTED: uncharacterized protein LOC102592512 isoform X3 [Solanum tuberosum]XP_015159028.1 PREDICTED: uncharacterized protein LOC102592512 isoform X3 [Solanum tuberosum]XP_015159031.1 PREDICTED: uncharacterized protein LOC102592512 isoform X3 [Solanum tuberosum]XP_015159035.1 PREDICTED: uncharacterized pro